MMELAESAGTPLPRPHVPLAITRGARATAPCRRVLVSGETDTFFDTHQGPHALLVSIGAWSGGAADRDLVGSSHCWFALEAGALPL